MIPNYKKKSFLFSLSLLLVFTAFSQNSSDELWTKSSALEKKSQEKVTRNTLPNKFEVFQLNLGVLDTRLSKAPKRNGVFVGSNTVISFPNEYGNLEQYQVFEASIMEKSLQEKHSNIKSYAGKSLQNPENTVRFSVTPLGLHAMFLKKGGKAVYIDPYTSDKASYIVYSKESLPAGAPFECGFEEFNSSSKETLQNIAEKVTNANDGNLRTFRLAIATTGEYSQFHLTEQGVDASATDEVKKAAVLSAIVVTMTRVNGVFERDLSLTMVLVANNVDVIFLDAASDGFSNNSASALINESQTTIDANIGSANYDIGHTFSTGGGGLAQLNSPCSSNKARGITGSGSPIGDAYDIDYVAHEMGHQYGANHSFNNSCGGNNNSSTAVEPGSGSTIMGYAGICDPNVQSNSDSYFHLISIREMWANISAGVSTCATITATGNTAPTVTGMVNYTIPKSTPFVLTATATDADGDALTYTWEQLDTEAATMPPVSTATGGPAFRSEGPSSSPKRYFPKQSTVIAGNTSTQWEVLPSVSRTMLFGGTVRDNNVAGGQTASVETTLTVDGDTGPFVVTSQTTSETWDAGTTKTITWDVANTNNAPVSCSNVNILLSTDGGNTYSVTLASNVSNSGSYDIAVPNNTTSTGRIMIESVGNVFYAINSVDITIQASEFIMDFDEYTKTVCAPNDGVYTFTYKTFLGFNETTTFSATQNPTGTTVTFDPASATADGTRVTMTVSGIDTDDAGTHTLTVTGTAAIVTKNTAATLNVYTATVDIPTLTTPANDALDVASPYTLTWGADTNALSYDVEIASDVAFASVVESANVATNTYAPLLLTNNTQYFWRVKSKNDCATGAFSSVFNFTTANIVCESFNSTGDPLAIPDNDTTGASSTINITNNKTITDVNVTVNITHTYDQDLTLTLTSPEGTTVVLAANVGSGGDNYTNTVFDSDVTESISSGTAPFTGTFSPQGDLADFNDEKSYGGWILKVVDNANLDTGTIDNWSLEICGIPSNDSDNDGVADADDACPNTPAGDTVDATGCTIFTLPADNYDITVISETCVDQNNGQLTITATATHNYVATISGTTHPFTDTVSITDLAPGAYEVCITVTGETYEQCYNITIAEGASTSGKASVSAKVATVQITQGTAPFTVFVNGKEKLQTQNSEFEVAVNHGDLLEVKTAVACEGTFSKEIALVNALSAYPNPTAGLFELALPENSSEVLIGLYNIHGQLISEKTYPVQYNKVQMNLENQPTGIYIVKVHLTTPVTLKIVKQ